MEIQAWERGARGALVRNAIDKLGAAVVDTALCYADTLAKLDGKEYAALALIAEGLQYAASGLDPADLLGCLYGEYVEHCRGVDADPDDPYQRWPLLDRVQALVEAGL